MVHVHAYLCANRSESGKEPPSTAVLANMPEEAKKEEEHEQQFNNSTETTYSVASYSRLSRRSGGE